MVQKNIQVICRIITSGTLILSRRIGSHVEFDFRALRNWARAGMVEWNGIFRLFRFSGILGQPREVHPKFRNEIPENVCSIRSQTRNVQNFWSNGKRPVHTGVPSGDPSLSLPVIANLNLGRIKQDLPKFRLQFTNAEQKWWEDFIRE